MEPPFDPATLAGDVAGNEVQVDTLLEKCCRAVDRNRSLRRKREDYMRWLQEHGVHQVPKQGVPRTPAQRRSKPHRSARALTRTCLAKGSMATCTDVPSVYLGRGSRSSKPKKPSVSPLLSFQQDVSLGQKGGAFDAWVNIVEASADMDTNEPATPKQPTQTSEATAAKEQLQRDCSTIPAALQALKEELRDNKEPLAVLLAIDLLLAGQPGSASTFIQAEGVPGLLECLQRWSKDHASVKAICGILANVVARETEGRSLVFAAGGTPVLLEAMRRFASCGEVQESCCKVLKEIAAMGAAARESLLQESGLETVLQAMKNHLPLARVQVAACGVLRNSSASSSECQAQLATLGAGQRVLQAMAYHSKDAALQCACCWALFCLCVQKAPFQQELARQGALHAALAAMKTQGASPKVQEAGCWVLRELAPTIRSDVLLWMEMVHAVAGAMRDHTGPEVQKAGLAARQRLAVRGFRLTQLQAQLVRPSIVKRRRMIAPALSPIPE